MLSGQRGKVLRDVASCVHPQVQNPRGDRGRLGRGQQVAYRIEDLPSDVGYPERPEAQLVQFRR